MFIFMIILCCGGKTVKVKHTAFSQCGKEISNYLRKGHQPFVIADRRGFWGTLLQKKYYTILDNITHYGQY